MIDLRLGDCLDVMRTLADGSVDAIVTDPPYSSGSRKEGQKGLRKSMLRATEDADWYGTDCLTTQGFLWLMRQNALRWKRLLKPGGHALIFIDWRMSPHLSAAIESADLRNKGVLVWDKTYFGMGDCFRNQHEFILHFTKGVGRRPQRRDMANVLSYAPIRAGHHPSEKPVKLLMDLLSVVAATGDRILDPFMGSGSTGVAAIEMGFDFLGIEQDPGYFAIAQKRLADSRSPHTKKGPETPCPLSSTASPLSA